MEDIVLSGDPCHMLPGERNSGMIKSFKVVCNCKKTNVSHAATWQCKLNDHLDTIIPSHTHSNALQNIVSYHDTSI